MYVDSIKVFVKKEKRLDTLAHNMNIQLGYRNGIRH